MIEGNPTRIYLDSPGAQADLQRMKKKAHDNPGSRDGALYEAVVFMLNHLNGRRGPTKELKYNPGFADLSDCDTTYVGADPNEKPPLRIVTIDSSPSQHGGSVDRDVVVIGQRANDMVYRIAGERLGRTRGKRLSDRDATHQPAPKLRADKELAEARYVRLMDIVDTWNPDSAATVTQIKKWTSSFLAIGSHLNYIGSMIATNPIAAQRRLDDLNAKLDRSLDRLDPRRTGPIAALIEEVKNVPSQFDEPAVSDYQPGG